MERPITKVYMPEGLNAVSKKLSLLLVSLRDIRGFEVFDFAVTRGL